MYVRIEAVNIQQISRLLWSPSLAVCVNNDNSASLGGLDAGLGGERAFHNE